MGWFDKIVQWFRAAKKAVKLVEQLDKIDIERRNVELEIELVKAREALARQQEALALKQSVRFVSPYCFQENDPEPLCPVCWETKQLIVHLSPLEDWNGGQRRDCPSCNWTHYETMSNPRSIPMGRSRRPWR